MKLSLVLLSSLVAMSWSTVVGQAQSVRNPFRSSPPVSGPPLPDASGGSQGTFGTGWAQPYPQTGAQIRTDGYRDRGPYRSQTPQRVQTCPTGTRRTDAGACIR